MTNDPKKKRRGSEEEQLKVDDDITIKQQNRLFNESNLVRRDSSED
jgi:hypothetical protein